MSKTGRRNMSPAKLESLNRSRPKEIRNRAGGVLKPEHKKLADSFSKKDWDLYTYHCRRLGTPGRKANVMYEKILEDGIGGNVLAAAKLRAENTRYHVLFKQHLDRRWSDKEEYYYNKHNTEENFWKAMAKGIQARKDLHKVDSYWCNESDRDRLIKYLQYIFKKQNGLCAISGIPMTTLRRDEYMASPDRISSKNGYVRGNIWLTCWWVNKMKLDLEMDDFKQKIKILHDSMHK